MGEPLTFSPGTWNLEPGTWNLERQRVRQPAEPSERPPPDSDQFGHDAQGNLVGSVGANVQSDRCVNASQSIIRRRRAVLSKQIPHFLETMDRTQQPDITTVFRECLAQSDSVFSHMMVHDDNIAVWTERKPLRIPREAG